MEKSGQPREGKQWSKGTTNARIKSAKKKEAKKEMDLQLADSNTQRPRKPGGRTGGSGKGKGPTTVTVALSNLPACR